eukprot:1649610-Rhodomonas_salina.1
MAAIVDDAHHGDERRACSAHFAPVARLQKLEAHALQMGPARIANADVITAASSDSGVEHEHTRNLCQLDNPPRLEPSAPTDRRLGDGSSGNER